MKHQICFLGGQLLPIYIGIKEFCPDRVYFIASEESKQGISMLKGLFNDIKYAEYMCDAFDFKSIRDKIESILSKINESDEISINLTGGTKIMLLAAQSIIAEKKIKGFYVNQDYSLIEVPSYQRKVIASELSINDYFALSGHVIAKAKKIEDFAETEYVVSKKIESFALTNKIYSRTNDFIRKKYKSIPESGKETINSNVSIEWNNGNIDIKNNSKSIARFSSLNIKDLYFNAVWWELIVAREVSKWVKAKEIMLQCILPFKSDDTTLKNEIDILLNTGNKLVFIECKSGNIKQEDINKMRIIKQTYGGTISKSLLVSCYIPSPTIIEKCKELDIEVFYCYAFSKQVNPLSKIHQVLDGLIKRYSM
jgi:hypothetical protein